jgi:hypothetical protein
MLKISKMEVPHGWTTVKLFAWFFKELQRTLTEHWINMLENWKFAAMICM